MTSCNSDLSHHRPVFPPTHMHLRCLNSCLDTYRKLICLLRCELCRKVHLHTHRAAPAAHSTNACINRLQRNYARPCTDFECGAEEDASHIIFECPIATFQWAIMRDIMKWKTIPRNITEFFEIIDRYNNRQSSRVMIIVLGMS